MRDALLLLVLGTIVVGCGDDAKAPARPQAVDVPRALPPAAPSPPARPPPAMEATVIDVVAPPEAEIVVEESEVTHTLPASDLASVPALSKWLDTGTVKEKGAALSALARLGVAARPAIPAIERCLEDRHGKVRIAAARALWEVGATSDRSLATLLDALKRGTETVRIDAAFVLRTMGSAAAPAVDALRAVLVEAAPPAGAGALRSDDATIEDAYIDVTPASAAAEALGRIGPAARTALPELRTAAASKDAVLRAAAAEAVRRLERRAR